ncbi:PEPxxWA-CTERM sorting domain-containing protein [Sphingomonas sp. KR1UV-12]|uniref:PEPxxWA-CTERM sorting domain-containing protein n=1 Tax=Sphingomonas aurea TaxID=3063994 RepID=A0ABT9EMJ1_9SPHN|nr:PEPxxWA-CTERM sorting domain-containing protein [Sphingomonas sp. KR1UV-12]MDP1028166.1 PEPxxWA-CTERM sorting domain-containing protein [Sphingomonas sp. KR1UV-12]
MTTKFLVAAGLLAGFATPATAATLLLQNGSTATFAAPAGTVIDFSSALPASFTASYSNAAIVTGDLVNAAAQPAFSDGSAYLAVGQAGSATLASTGLGYQSVSFFIGSIDSFNSVQVLSTTGQLIASYAGTAFTATPNGNQELSTTNRRITITRDATDALIGGIRFLSDGNALEVDNVVFAVPEPSTWALMLLGFGMVGTATRYRRRSRQVVYG